MEIPLPLTYIFVIFLVLFCSREATVYNSNLIFKRYITVNNKILAKILIGKTNYEFRNEKDKENNEENNKLLIYGLVFYVLTFIFLILHIFSLLTDSFLVELSFNWLISIAFFANAFNVLNASKYKKNKAKNKKSSVLLRFLYIALNIFTGAAFVFAGFLSLFYIN